MYRIATVASLVLTLTVPAHAAVLCAKTLSDGTFDASVKIREYCRSRETQLDPAVLGLQSEQGPEGPPGEARAVMLLDGLGNPIGTVIGRYIEGGTFRYFTVFEPTTGKTLTLGQFSPSDGSGVEVVLTRGAAIRFAGLDCTGQTYISFGEALDPTSLYVNGNSDVIGHRLFAPEERVPAGTLTFSDLGGNSQCDNNAGVPLPDASYTATEVTMPFPVPIVPPLQIVEGP